MPYYRTAAIKKDDNTRELIIQADSKEEAFAKIPSAKAFLFPGEDSENYVAYPSPFQLTVNLGTTITYYRITVHRPTEKESSGEPLETEDIVELDESYEWILEAEDAEDAKSQMRNCISEEGKDPENYRIYADEMSVEDCIKEEERSIEHSIKSLYYQSFGYYDRPIREMRTYSKEMDERGDLYYKAVKFAARVARLYRGLERQIDLSQISAKDYKDYIIRLAKADVGEEYQKIMKELKGV